MDRSYLIKSETLWLVTAGFLAFPIGIFAIGWASPAWSAPVILCLAAGVFLRLKSKEETPVSIPLWSVFVLAISCISICVLAGVGGFTYQDGDYYKHNAILTDLFRRDWPVAYVIEHEGKKHPVALVYYVAYYLPPALIGKLAGWEALRYSMVIWTAGGMFLMCLWCLKFAKGALWAPIAFLAFGGFDMFGMILGLKAFSWMPELWLEHRQMEWWAGFCFGNFPTHSNHLFWAPQHALPGGLIVAAALHRIRSGTLDGCAFLLALSTLWSPFITVGMIPIGLAGLWISHGKGSLARSNLAAIPILAVGILFLTARGVPDLPIEGIPIHWNHLNPLRLGFTFVLEVLPWTLLLLWGCRYDKFSKTLGIACVVFLAVLPIWRIGTFNDLMMRASLPAFAMLSLLLLQAVGEQSRVWKKVALAILMLGSGGLVFDLVRHIEFMGGRASQTDFTSPAKVPPLPLTPDLSGLLDQYLGSTQSSFIRIIARPLPLVDDSMPFNGQAPPAGVMEKQNEMQKNLRQSFERGARSRSFLQEYATISYYQGDMWESMLALETMVKQYPADPNARLNLAVLLSSSGIQAYRERALSELNAARRLAQDPAALDRATKDLRKSLETGQ